tara:strand:+ start:768 stop:1229 length:462 start_codon:yes stop_codon:yes gene_type:complete
MKKKKNLWIKFNLSYHKLFPEMSWKTCLKETPTLYKIHKENCKKRTKNKKNMSGGDTCCSIDDVQKAIETLQNACTSCKDKSKSKNKKIKVKKINNPIKQYSPGSVLTKEKLSVHDMGIEIKKAFPKGDMTESKWGYKPVQGKPHKSIWTYKK